VLIKEHHPGYVTWDEYLAIEARLSAGWTAFGARPVREGERTVPGASSTAAAGADTSSGTPSTAAVSLIATCACQVRTPLRPLHCIEGADGAPKYLGTLNVHVHAQQPPVTTRSAVGCNV
jgi:hypothetical protein